LSIQGVIKYQTMISIAYLGFGCVRTTLSSIWILYSPLYKSPLSWTIFNSDNVHVLGTYNDGFNSYSCWLSSKFLSNCFLIQKKVHYRRYIKCIFHCSIYLLCCKNVWMQQFYFVATSYCHNSILYRYILLLPKITNAIVVNNIEQYVVATSFFLLRTTFWLQK